MDQFLAVDIRVGTIVRAEIFVEARKPSYKLVVDFGPEIGMKRSSAQITQLYDVDSLVGVRVLAVVNFEPKRIAGFLSEVLCLGVDDHDGNVVLLKPDRVVPNGRRVY